MRRIAVLLVAVIVCPAALPQRAQAGSIVRVGILQQPNTLNPLIESEFFENYIDEAVFSGLTVLDDRQRIQPDLATVVPSRENGGVSADGKTITYHSAPRGEVARRRSPHGGRCRVYLREDARPVDPVSVVEQLPGRHRRARGGSLTVVVRLKRPSADALIRIFVNGQFGSIVPKHVLAGVTSMRTAPFNAKPIGTGPYQVERWDRGSQILLRANPSYFRGKPPIDEIAIKFIADSNSLAIGLRTGEIDLSPNLAPSTLPIVTSVAHLRLLQAPSIDMLRVEFNTTAPPFDDVRVRKASRRRNRSGAHRSKRLSRLRTLS